MNEFLLGLLIFLVVMTGLCVAMFARDVGRLRSVQSAQNDGFVWWSLVYAMLGLMGALVCTAGLLREQEGNWRVVSLVLINMLIQPLCCFAVAMGGFKVIMALTARITCGFRIIPREDIEPDLSRAIWLNSVAGGTMGLLFFGSMGLACLLSLL